ncbi:MAG: hypothetical protein WDN46_12990 [Methylocella sp.]
MKCAENFDRDELLGVMGHYKYQTNLTKQLDTIYNDKFDQNIVNEIVLWKINRYARLSEGALKSLNALKNLPLGAHREARLPLEQLMDHSGIDLPMASTLLRFRNPQAFQIIDRRAYRAIFCVPYPLHSTTPIIKKIDTYFAYLEKVIKLSISKNLDFQIIDRILYQLDKDNNGTLSSAKTEKYPRRE